MSQPEIQRSIEALADTPVRILKATENAPPSSLHLTSDKETWSVNDVLAHLRTCADIWGGSIEKMIAQDHPTFRYVSPRTWMRKTDYSDLPFTVNLEAFVSQRTKLLDLLRGLPADGWSRGATFTATTRGREQTVLSYAVRLAQHEDGHCVQIEALVELYQ